MKQMKQHGDFDRWTRAVGSCDAFLALAGLLQDQAVIVLDAGRRVLVWAGEAERLLGWTREEILGQPCPNGVVCDGMPSGTPSAFGAVFHVRRADGSRLVARHYGRLVKDDKGAPCGSIHLLVPESYDPPPRPDGVVRFHGIVTREPVMLAVFDMVRNVGETDATVLVRGESGTGKELVARAIHACSHRAEGPFVAVNCGALTPTLLESELFGHKRGAFTGAHADREGIFAQADGGTLFLDEVAELPIDLQVKLLRVLQERTFVPLGGTKPQTVDVRIVAATHKALREEARAGRFREDLMYRLRVVPIFLPPLRERPRDIELLLRDLIAVHTASGPRRVERIAPDAMRALLEHTWPGNVRELMNVVAYACAVGRGPEVSLAELPPELRELRVSPPEPTDSSADARSAAAVRQALAATDGDLEAAAALLGISRVTLWRRRKRYGI